MLTINLQRTLIAASLGLLLAAATVRSWQAPSDLSLIVQGQGNAVQSISGCNSIWIRCTAVPTPPDCYYCDSDWTNDEITGPAPIDNSGFEYASSQWCGYLNKGVCSNGVCVNAAPTGGECINANQADWQTPW